MRHCYPLILLAFAALPARMSACSCFGPQTFCETLNPQPPQFPEPEWWQPSDIVLAVKLNGYAYGADMKVVQVFSGDVEPGQTMRVWGDCGLLCRQYVNGVADGDTVLWALQHCDLWGNGPCGTSLESEGDYQLSVCGVYSLDYAGGMVSGSLTMEGWAESVTMDEFTALVTGCLPMSVPEFGSTAPTVRLVDDCLLVQDAGQGTHLLQVLDSSGRLVHAARFTGPQAAILLPRRLKGLFLARLDGARNTTSHRIVLP